MDPVAVALAGSAAVLAFDAAAALASRAFGFPYLRLAAGSLAIYAATGWLAARPDEPYLVGAAAGAAVAAVDATFGWRVGRALGVDEEAISERMEMAVATAVTLCGGALGGLAALLT